MKLTELHAIVQQSDLLFNKQQINDALIKQAEELSQMVSSSDASEPPIVLPVMNGGLIYAGQLLTELSFPVQIDYIHATRYRNSTTGFELEWKVYPQHELKDRVVIILDDIFDEGHTLTAIADYCREQGAKQVVTSVLVTKEHDRREEGMQCDYSALMVPDRYVFGYGMDYKGQLRNLDGIYAIGD